MSLEVDEESIVRRRVRTWEVGRPKGSERRSGVGECVSGVEAVDEGDDRGSDGTVDNVAVLRYMLGFWCSKVMRLGDSWEG